jgi:hypothetical protein
MERKEYNGWTNYETWCVNLWMSNDQGSDEYFRELAQEVYDESEKEDRADGKPLFTRDEVATRVLADRLKDQFEEQQSELTGVTGVFADLLSGALSEVDWYEIAEHYIEDVDKEDPEDSNSQSHGDEVQS